MVSTTPAVPVAKFAVGVVDILVVHLDLRISLQNKFKMTPIVIFGGLREDHS